MKLIIAGSRTIQVDYTTLKGLINLTGKYPKEIISGTARGIDESGEKYVEITNRDPSMVLTPEDRIKLTRFPADWDKHGKKAGILRNTEMANYADALLLIWDGESKGSANMKYQMNQLGKPIYEVILRKHNV